MCDDRLDTRPGLRSAHTKRVNELKANTERIFSEGQLFYFYKRHNYRTFPYCVKENMAGFYQWPLPDNEIILAIIKFDKDEKYRFLLLLFVLSFIYMGCEENDIDVYDETPRLNLYYRNLAVHFRDSD